MNHIEHLDLLIREIDAIQSRPFRRIPKRIAPLPARSTVDVWVDQFVNLLVIR